ncbi:MAG TPA: hypothetical protein VK590_11660 [Saprospiraceae bacterium]|nr:hypothetical protein [Saprospiraceae bacterium]
MNFNKLITLFITVGFILPISAQVTGGGKSTDKSSSPSGPRLNNVFNFEIVYSSPSSSFGNTDPFSGPDALGVRFGIGIGIGHEFVRGFYLENYNKFKIGFKQRLEADFHKSKFESDIVGFTSESPSFLNMSYRLGLCSKYYVNSDFRLSAFALGGFSYLHFNGELNFSTNEYSFSRYIDKDIFGFSYEIGADISYKSYFVGLSFVNQKSNLPVSEEINSNVENNYNINTYTSLPLSFNYFKLFIGLYF